MSGPVQSVTYLDGVPQFSPTTMRMYGRLPEKIRADDATVGSPPNDFPLLRFLALVGDQLDRINTIIDRCAYIPPFNRAALDAATPGMYNPATSDLADPSTADSGWLGWLAQIYGTVLTPGMTVPQQRHAIGSASSGWQAGTKDSMIRVAAGQLTGSKFVQLVDHVGGDMWKMQIITRPSESPTPDTVISAIEAAACKPVGVTLTHLYYEASWATVEAELPTWTAWESAGTSDPLLTAGSWGAISETQPGAVEGAAWSTVENAFPTWSGWETAGEVNVATLAAALTSGATVTSLTTTALSAAVAAGDPVQVTSGTNSQTFTAAAAAAAGATSITVTSTTANFGYPTGAGVADLAGAGTWAHVQAG